MTENHNPKEPRAKDRPDTPKQLQVLGELARGMGIATRSMVDGVNRLVGVFGGPSKPAPAARPARKSEAHKKELERLARELLLLTEGVEAEGTGLLLAKREFWLLLTKLQTLRARLPPSQRPDAAAPQVSQPAEVQGASSGAKRAGAEPESAAAELDELAEPAAEGDQPAEAAAAPAAVEGDQQAEPAAEGDQPAEAVAEPAAAAEDDEPGLEAGLLTDSAEESGVEEAGGLEDVPDIEGARAVDEPAAAPQKSKRKKKE